MDEQGVPLPGAAVTLEGLGEPLHRVTDATGSCHFLNLDPGIYVLTVELPGYSTLVFPDVRIDVGRVTSCEATLSPAIVDVITVT